MPPSRARRRRATATSRPSTARTAATCPPGRPLPTRDPTRPAPTRARFPRLAARTPPRGGGVQTQTTQGEGEGRGRRRGRGRGRGGGRRSRRAPLAKQTTATYRAFRAKRARHVAGSGAPTSGVMKQLFLDLGQKNFGHVRARRAACSTRAENPRTSARTPRTTPAPSRRREPRRARREPRRAPALTPT